MTLPWGHVFSCWVSSGCPGLRGQELSKGSRGEAQQVGGEQGRATLMSRRAMPRRWQKSTASVICWNNHRASPSGRPRCSRHTLRINAGPVHYGFAMLCPEHLLIS